MDPDTLHQLAQSSRDQSQKEKALLFEAAMRSRRAAADDTLFQRVVEAADDLEAINRKAADLGHDEATVVRLSVQFYDVRAAALEELNRSSSRTPDPYPQLRKEGPFVFGDLDRWARELELPDPESTAPLAWLDVLGRWLIERQKAGAVARLLRRKERPPMPPMLDELYSRCERDGLHPRFHFYEILNDRGLDLKVRW